MGGPVQKSTVERSLDASIKDGTAFAVMAGLGDATVVGACALFLGASKSAVALLVTLPVFLGACAQLLSPVLIERTGRRKLLFLAGSFVQALSWVPMIAALFAPPPLGFWLLLGGFVLSFAAVHVGVPAWTSVMGDLVPPEVRGRYFGRRSALAFVMQFMAMLVAGAGLEIYQRARHEKLGFAVVFGGALLARLISVYYIARMAEPPYAPRHEDRFTFMQFLKRLPRSNFARFALFVASLNFSAHFVGCLFIPYWRETLAFSYVELMAVGSAIVFIQIPALPFWGRAADRFGNKRVLVVTSCGIAVLPMLWLLTTHVALAVFLQMWSGFFWSGFNQSVSNFLLDAVTPGKRARCTAYLNLLLNTGVLLGGLAGSWAITWVPVQLGPVTMPWPFWTVLVMSFLLRVLTLVLFLPRFREVRDVPQVGVVEMLFHATREVTEAAINLLAGRVPPDEEAPSRRDGAPPAPREEKS
jgi:MFS family permease